MGAIAPLAIHLDAKGARHFRFGATPRGIAVEEQLRTAVLFALIFEPTFLPGFRASCPGFSLPTGQENSIETVIASTYHTQRNRNSCPLSGSDALASQPLLLTTTGEHRLSVAFMSRSPGNKCGFSAHVSK